MFDNVTIYKAFKVMDTVKNSPIDVCTFNAILNSSSGVNMSMNINYPNLYSSNREAILVEYRKFSSDVTALAVSMGLASTIESDPTILQNLEKVREEMTKIANDVFNQVLATLEDITVNPVPIMEVGANNNPYASGTAPFNDPTLNFTNGMR